MKEQYVFLASVPDPKDQPAPAPQGTLEIYNSL